MFYVRDIESQIDKFLKKDGGKILFIWGPRRSGKTTLLEKIAKNKSLEIFNFDLSNHVRKFTPDELHLSKIAKNNKIILIDEVQNSPKSSRALKILVDIYKKKIVATGSSELRQKSGEDFDTLTDRFEEAFCLPIAINEVVINQPKNIDEEALTENLQIYGAYPEILLSNLTEPEKIEKLEKIVDTYVVKDIVDIYNLKDLDLAKKVLTKIALQLGSEVSLRELANGLKANVSTVASYIEIFIKNYVLIPLPSFKTNARRAVSENRKLYFYDLGVRNALIKDFRETDLRPDAGGVWENLIISELEKSKRVNKLLQTHYFYREYGGKEIDLVIEDYKKNYTCIEIKKNKGKINKIFPLPHNLKVISKSNFVKFFE